MADKSVDKPAVDRFAWYPASCKRCGKSGDGAWRCYLRPGESLEAGQTRWQADIRSRCVDDCTITLAKGRLV